MYNTRFVECLYVGVTVLIDITINDPFCVFLTKERTYITFKLDLGGKCSRWRVGTGECLL